MPDILEIAEAIDDKIIECGIYAKALRYCHCGEVLIREFDDDAERHTYALVTRLHKNDNDAFSGLDRAELMANVKDVIEGADDDCYQCGA